ncbi:DNA replication and repair protein RecF [Geotalea uraniireducens]|uniref:DNA replication and repair protein RecF n=1 Tax=Geotalea uraniireducens TaxID=351604 RepID=A0ABM8EQP9_9BACT|nr:DNA replication/repair protein RecF [Geotalea uraniireducens]BDV44936.1 DNA replication and repair protein RecF [Geotalea uraniireducens]
MFLTKIQINSFRNIAAADLVFNRRFNIFTGDNGQGKSSILEAIYLLGTMKSFRLARTQDLISWDTPHAFVQGRAEKDGVTREIALYLGKEGRKARIDRKPVTRLADFFGAVNAVVFSPEEIGMARGGPELRRRYLDRAIFSSDLGYLMLYHEYYRILKQRNSLLKRGDQAGLEVWTDQLAEAGIRLMEKRIAYLAATEPLLGHFYRQIAGGDETAGLAYRPHACDPAAIDRDGKEALIRALSEHRAEELRRGTTVVGPHRDDLEFLLNGRVIKHHGSQGQQRSFVLALKMAEVEYLEKLYGAPPILLLDDISSELDRQRNENLMQFLRQKSMQVFVTTTDPATLRLDGIDTHAAFRVEQGKVILTQR